MKGRTADLIQPHTTASWKKEQGEQLRWALHKFGYSTMVTYNNNSNKRFGR